MIKCNSLIAILMATYNGEKYIREQLDSLIAQTCCDWTLFVNDDGSSDRTLQILYEYSRLDSRIIILDLPKRGDACQNFLTLLSEVDAQYYMFCDQDDIWHKDKIEVSFNAMRSDKPMIVHTDLRMVDAKGRCIEESFWKYSRIFPQAITEFRHYASSCVATGCTMIFNQSAKDCVIFNPRHARMHDAWVTLCVAKKGGFVLALNHPTIDYRQHDSNSIGAPDQRRFTFRFKIRNIKRIFDENIKQYLMLSELGYPGGILTYIKEKIAYHRLS